MIIHFHHTTVPNAGETKRMKNIDKYVAGFLSDKVVEVEFYRRDRIKYVHSEGRFTLSDNVIKKYYILHFPRLGKIDCVYRSLVLSYLGLKYSPSHIIGELWMFPSLKGIFSKLVKNCKIVFDVHGASVEEAKYQLWDKNRINEVIEKERYSLQISDYIICQSDEMKRYIVETYGVDPNIVCVFRCGVDTNLFHVNDTYRKQIRKELGIPPKETLFVYSGGMHQWQRIEDSLHIFRKYNRLFPQSKYLVITGEQDRLKEILRKKEFSDLKNKILVRTLQFENVPQYLNAADIAFLLRHNHIMNAVASPTKLAEYLACGLPIITSKVAEKWVSREGLHYLLIEQELDNDINKISKIITSTKKEDISNFARENLSLEIDINNMRAFFLKQRKI